MWKSLFVSIEEYCRKKNIQHALLEARVVQKWPEIVGRRYPGISVPTKVSRVEGNILYILVGEPMWIGELEKNGNFFLQAVQTETNSHLKRIVFSYRPFCIQEFSPGPRGIG